MTQTKAKRKNNPHTAANRRAINHFNRDMLIGLLILVLAKVGNLLTLVSDQIVTTLAMIMIFILVWRLCTLGAAFFWENIIVDKIHEYELMNKSKREEPDEDVSMNYEHLEDSGDDIPDVSRYSEIEHAATQYS